MYKKQENNNMSLYTFNESLGVKLDETKQIIKIADYIQWHKYEDKYADLFPSNKGRPAHSFRVACATLILQAYTGLSDRKLEEAISENPYYQYFIGCNEYTTKAPVCHSSIGEFRKRITPDMVNELNDEIIKFIYKENGRDFDNPDGQLFIENCDNEGEITFGYENDNLGTAIINATCSPQNIKYPQDYVLLNDARIKTEEIIDKLYSLSGKKGVKPRTYRRKLNQDYLKVAKMRRKNTKTIRSLIRKLLHSIERNMRYISCFQDAGLKLNDVEAAYIKTIKKLFEQQKYMFQNNTHQVKDRIVSIHQPYIRPIVRGKAKNPVEFGAKYEVLVDENHIARLEKISFNPYNESETLIDSIKKFKAIRGHYPERVLVDQIYRTQKIIKFCNDHNIVISGPRLGRPPKNEKISKNEKEQNRRNNVDRIEVERFFSKTKRCFGANLIKTKLADTTFTVIGFIVLAANLFSLDLEPGIFLYYFFDNCSPKSEIDQIWMF